MELRIKGNSLRLGVTRTDLRTVAGGGRVEEAICFTEAPEAKLIYALQSTEHDLPIRIAYHGQLVTVLISLEEFKKWAVETVIGVYETIDLGQSGILTVVIEKDFACLDRRREYDFNTSASLYAARLQKQPSPDQGSSLPRRPLQRVLELMNAELSSKLSLEILAAESGYSRNHFSRTFRAATGLTPHNYLLELRLAKAQELLADKSLRLIDIAALCGFSSHAHLTTAFRAKFGYSPSAYRRPR